MKKSNLLKAFGLTALAAVSLGLFAFNGSVNAEDGTQAPKIVFEKDMINTDGYKPTASDTFNLTFTQKENYAKFWTSDWVDEEDANTIVSPRISVDLGPVTIAGTGAEEGIQESVKKSYATFTSFDKITKAGLYTYLVTEQTPSTPWTQVDPSNPESETVNPTIHRDAPKEASLPTYVLKIKATNGGTSSTGLNYEVTMSKIVWNDDKQNYELKKINADGGSDNKTTEAVFANRLADDYTNRPKTSVTIHKFVTGDGLDSVKKDQDYTVEVTFAYTPMFEKNTLTTENDFTPETKLSTDPKVDPSEKITYEGNNFASTFKISFPKHGGSVTIPNVPVGTKITVNEKGLPVGFKAVNVPNSKEPAADSSLLSKADFEKAGGKSFMAVSQVDDTNINEGSVTNGFFNIVNTGLKFMTSPFVILLAMVVVAGGAYVVAKRKISE